MSNQKIINGDSLEVLKTFPDNHFDSVVTDPPYGLSFMGKKWDYDVPSVELWNEVFRVLKPGGHMLVACGTRTQHRMAVNIEDARFEIRDVITWHYGSGFPKSLDVSKAIDKQQGVEREITKIGQTKSPEYSGKFDQVGSNKRERRDNPVSSDAKQWQGWGTALKPATEFWTLARKPISEKTVAQNVIKYGTGGINIDGCRIDVSSMDDIHAKNPHTKGGFGHSDAQIYGNSYGAPKYDPSKGRFPANVIFDEEAGKLLDEQSGNIKTNRCENASDCGGNTWGGTFQTNRGPRGYSDDGGASRFFYCAKASSSERNKGLENLGFEKKIGHNRFDKCKTCGNYILQNPGRPSACKCENPVREDNTIIGNHHPTVKPIKLMQYLVRMISPTNSICLDPFNGSGSTGIACKLEGVNYIGIEREREYCDISEARIKAWGDLPNEEESEDGKTDSNSPEKNEGKSQLDLF